MLTTRQESTRVIRDQMQRLTNRTIALRLIGASRSDEIDGWYAGHLTGVLIEGRRAFVISLLVSLAENGVDLRSDRFDVSYEALPASQRIVIDTHFPD